MIHRDKFLKSLILAVVLVCINIALLPPLTAQSLYNYVRENLYKLIEIQGVSPKFVEREVVIRSSVLLHRFYKNRNFRPAWFEDSALIPQVNPLIKTISRADQEGLRPDDYHLNQLPRRKRTGY